MDMLFNVIGMVGVFTLLVAYFLVQRGTIAGQGLYYPSLNFTGAGLVAISLLNDWNLPAFVMEAVWMAVSLFGIGQYLYRKKKAK